MAAGTGGSACSLFAVKTEPKHPNLCYFSLTEHPGRQLRASAYLGALNCACRTCQCRPAKNHHQAESHIWTHRQTNSQTEKQYIDNSVQQQQQSANKLNWHLYSARPQGVFLRVGQDARGSAGPPGGRGTGRCLIAVSLQLLKGCTTIASVIHTHIPCIYAHVGLGLGWIWRARGRADCWQLSYAACLHTDLASRQIKRTIMR